MAKSGIPYSIDDVTPDWLTASLTGAGTIGGARITSFDLVPVEGGSGLFGTVKRLTPTYEPLSNGAPASMIVKIPTAEKAARDIGGAFRLYEREVHFYRHLAERIPMPTPHCLAAEMAPESGRFALLLEDLSDRRLGDQLAGWSDADADIAVEQLARLHAAYWDETGIGEQDWLPAANAPTLLGLVHGAYQQSWQPFTAHFGDHLPPRLLSAGEALCERLPDLADKLAAPPRTLVHGDYRMDNMIFGNGPGEAPLTIIDWQLVARARGAFDLAYFLAQGGDPERRKACEMRLLRSYHELLQAHGVTGYDFDQLFLDYRASILYGLVYIVISVGSLVNADERMHQLFATALERTVTAIMELDAIELLPA